MENEVGWEVALDYQVIPGRALEAVIYDEETYEAIEPGKHYEPFVCRELPAKFAQLRLDDEQGVLAFAGTYGLLGYGDLERIGLHRFNEPEPLHSVNSNHSPPGRSWGPRACSPSSI